MDREDSKLSSSSAEEAISSDEDEQKTTGDRAPDAAGLILATAAAAGAPITPKDLAQRAKHAADLFGSVEDWGDVTRTLTACGALQPFTRPPPQQQPLPPAKQARLEEDGARLYHASRVAPFHARAFDLARDGRFEELEAACGSAAATTLKAWCFHMSPKWATLRRTRRPPPAPRSGRPGPSQKPVRGTGRRATRGTVSRRPPRALLVWLEAAVVFVVEVA